MSTLPGKSTVIIFMFTGIFTTKYLLSAKKERHILLMYAAMFFYLKLSSAR